MLKRCFLINKSCLEDTTENTEIIHNSISAARILHVLYNALSSDSSHPESTRSSDDKTRYCLFMRLVGLFRCVLFIKGRCNRTCNVQSPMHIERALDLQYPQLFNEGNAKKSNVYLDVNFSSKNLYVNDLQTRLTALRQSTVWRDLRL